MLLFYTFAKILSYMEEKIEKKYRRVIHVHFIVTKENFYFTSVRAVYKKFSSKELGITERALYHQLNSDGSKYHNNNSVLIVRGKLLT